MRWTARCRTASLSLAICLSPLGLAVAPAAAAPGAGTAAPLAALAHSRSDVTPVLLVRKCWTRRGVAHCRWIDGAVRPYRWWDPNRYPTGSTAWWRAMEREGRGGFRR